VNRDATLVRESFATVFSYTMAKELAPEVLKAGCRAGAPSGQKTAEGLASKLGGRADDPCVVQSPGADPSGPATQPGAA